MYRPTVSVFNHKDEKAKVSDVRMPPVFYTPLRSDIVQFVHDNLSRNSRQAHGVDPRAGMKHSAESWGTGRAVARIPRIGGSGTHRSGQGAFGNMCRKGRMAFGLKTWRRWHRKVNLRQRRHALASAIAATAVTSLVMARGHRVTKVPQLPLILDDEFTKVQKTKEAIAVLKRFGAFEDVERVVKNKTLRAGKSKARGKKYKQRRGPLIIVNDKSESLYRATRNIPGVTVLNVQRLNIKHLAPGGQFGRFCIYTKGAFEELARQFGSYNGASVQKKGYMLKREVISNPDIAAIINSDEVQRVLKDKKTSRALHPRQKKNPLKNKDLMNKLNPYEAKKREEMAKRKGQKIKKTKAEKQKYKTQSKEFLTKVTETLDNTEKRIYDDYKHALAMTKV